MSNASKINQLEKLEKMYQNGHFSKREYKKLRAEIISGKKNVEIHHTTYSRRKSGCLGTLFKWFVIIFIALPLAFAFLVSMLNDKPSSHSPTNSKKIMDTPQPTPQSTDSIETQEPIPKPEKNNENWQEQELKPTNKQSDSDSKAVDNLF